MKAKTAETLLCAYRKGKANDPAIEKAMRVLENDSELRRRLEEQGRFDEQMGRALGAIAPPEGLRRRVFGLEEQRKGKPQFAVPTIVAAVCGLATILVLGIIFAMESNARFPGSDGVARLISSANNMTGLEMVPVSTSAGELGDWFYMRGFESFHLPPELAATPALGSRLLKQDGHTVAQIAVDWHHAVFYVFRADSFGVTLPAEGVWKRMEVEGWEAAIRKDGNVCTLVAIRGERSEMTDLLKSLEKAKR